MTNYRPLFVNIMNFSNVPNKYGDAGQKYCPGINPNPKLMFLS